MQQKGNALAGSTASPVPAVPGLFSSPHKRSFVLSLLLVMLTLGLYNSVIYNGFINVDDNGYVTDNKQVHQGLTPATLRWALTTYECENWHPLTWVSHALDWELFGKDAAGHHYVSALLHALNAVLLFLLLQNVTGFPWRSWIVAALFAVHPVNVESVAWVAERKNVLSMLFFLLTLMAYGWYARKPSVRRYGAVATLFALALMAKPQVITLPCVLLLWDYWPLERFGSAKTKTAERSIQFVPAPFLRLVLEKIPLLLLSAADALLTMRAQHNVVDRAQSVYSMGIRLSNALVAYTRYIGHAVWPTHLSPAYSHPGNSLPFWQVFAAGTFLLVVTALTVASRKRYLLVGWLWFLGVLVPMIGVIQVGDQAMADRYAYIPFIGLFWMVTWTIAEVAKDWDVSARWLAIPVCGVIVALGVLTPRQVRQWHDSETLWRYALAATDDSNFMAQDYLAAILTKEDKHDEAMQHYKIAEKLHAYPLTQLVDFADYELRHGHTADAVEDAQRVFQGTNDKRAREVASRVLGIGNTQLGKTPEAKYYYGEALKIDPQDPYALLGMGLLAYRQGDFSTAADYFSRTIAIDPSDFDYLVLATALQKAGRQQEADVAYAKAQRASSDWTQSLKKANWFLTN